MSWRERYDRYRRYGLDPLPADATRAQREARIADAQVLGEVDVVEVEAVEEISVKVHVIEDAFFRGDEDAIECLDSDPVIGAAVVIVD